MMIRRFLLSCFLLVAATNLAIGGEPQAEEKSRETKIAEYLTGSKFVGRYTTDSDKDASAKQETYTISKVEKLAEPDLYRLTSRIQYGSTD
ncbi:MAG TPA: hypothetical protein DDZ51_00945, partial [Planctomycetaceae bacterium]|nr:hypothetical protein [Planctomycetaceae bacterium]